MIVMKENQDRNIQNVYRQIVEISKKYQVKKVVLFGSRARGTNTVSYTHLRAHET